MVNSEERNELVELVSDIDKWVSGIGKVKELLVGANSEELLALLESVNTSNTKAWIAQSDILRHIHDSAGKFKSKAVESVASEIGLSRSYCFALLKINKKIFDEAEDLREVPNLTIGHFSNVINNLSRIQDPIALLRSAADNNWTVTQMREYLAGRSPNTNFTLTYYKIEEATNVSANTNWAGVDKLSNKINILTAQNGDKYLELKTYQRTQRTEDAD
jgi:hypothetical protein